jgi:hypothetical protein
MKVARNPRRAYDENGNEIRPSTVGRSVSQGFRTVMAYCEAHNCRHGGEVPLKGWHPELPVPDMALKLRYSKCGGRRIRMTVNVAELYAITYVANSGLRNQD